MLKFWRNAGAGGDVTSEVDDMRNSASNDDEESDDNDSFFDLVFKSPDRGGAKKRDGAKKCDGDSKEFQFIESPRDVFMSKSGLSSYNNNKPQSPVTILRSAPKFKVFMLGFKKSSKSESKTEQTNRIGPVFARDNSLRSKMLKESCDYDVVSSEKSVPKYLKLIKPFYVKSSSKTKLTESLTPLSSPVTAPVNLSSPRKFSEVSRVGSFKIMTRNLGKSRSASAAEGGAPPSIRRRDDSLMEQHDGIQGAILHCKKSYNTSSYREFSQLCRASSDASHDKLRRNSCEEQKRCSI